MNFARPNMLSRRIWPANIQFCGRARIQPENMPTFYVLRRFAAIGAACFLISGIPVCYAAPAGSTATGSADAPMSSGKPEEQPPGFNYTHLWTSKDGETHITECEMKGFVKKPFAQGGGDQYTKESTIKPIKTSFTQLPVDSVNPLHSCPGTQWVTPLAGSWYVETTDGTRREFGPGEIMFQDNSKDSPADKAPQHESGTVGDEPCNQLVLQVDRAPEVDKPCPF